MSDREPFEQARAAGLAKRHERRLAHAQVAEAREALIREFSGLIDADACVADMPAWLRAFGERLLGLPILTPEEVEAETKALAETATKLGYELGRKEAREEAVADLRFLAEARKDYCARCPETQNDYAEMRPAELAVHEEHTAATRLADILDGKNDGMGWLPSWRWDEWAARKQVEA